MTVCVCSMGLESVHCYHIRSSTSTYDLTRIKLDLYRSWRDIHQPWSSKQNHLIKRSNLHTVNNCMTFVCKGKQLKFTF